MRFQLICQNIQIHWWLFSRKNSKFILLSCFPLERLRRSVSWSRKLTFSDRDWVWTSRQGFVLGAPWDEAEPVPQHASPTAPSLPAASSATNHWHIHGSWGRKRQVQTVEYGDPWHAWSTHIRRRRSWERKSSVSEQNIHQITISISRWSAVNTSNTRTINQFIYRTMPQKNIWKCKENQKLH